ncbi:unnamed protein product [Callosobruchus maculatus]|uniref:MADF domain-containing protein n=1 Tax=Callosobruchus maculatus TaxID=64391 RepID=A0A653C6E8_CALMS|nr:unnamed protein product [Callosobruchus maculatus]
MRQTALTAIRDVLKAKKPNITIAEIQPKFQALKQNAQKERRKCIDSQKSGSGTDEILHPSLLYYDLIEFAFQDTEPRPGVDSFAGEEPGYSNEGTHTLLEDSMSEAGEIFSTIITPEGMVVEEVVETPVRSRPPSPPQPVSGPSRTGHSVPRRLIENLVKNRSGKIPRCKK